MAVQVVDIPVTLPGPKEIQFDEEWLAIIRETHGIMNLSRSPTRFPTAFASPPPAATEHRAAVAEALASAGGPTVPKDGFARTVDAGKRGQGNMPTSIPRNPQSEAVLRLIGQPWNLGGEEASAAAVSGAWEPLTGADILGDDGNKVAAGDAMFQRVDIHNMNPHAISDAKAQAGVGTGAPAGGDSCGSGGAPGARCVVNNPEEIDLGADSSDDA